MDAISYSYADKAHKRIKKFINDPDSSSGILTVPKIVATGESVTIPSGRVAVLPGVQVDGTMTVNGEVFIPSGSSYTDTNIDSTNAVFDTLKVQGQNVSPYSGFKNYIINGNFDIWQYGLSQTNNGYGSVDRWINFNVGTTKQTLAVVTSKTEPFNAIRYSRTIVSSVVGVSNACGTQQRIEWVNTLAGKTATLSFYAKADSNKNIAVDFIQYFGSGGTPSTIIEGISATKFAITSTWVKYTITVNIPSIAGKLSGTDNNDSLWVRFWFDAGSGYNSRTANLGQQSGTFDIAQVQLEEGSIATPFEQRPYGLELALCQRYYEVLGVTSFHGYGSAGNGFLNQHEMRVTKRVAPTISVGAITSQVNCGIGTMTASTDIVAMPITVTTTGAFVADVSNVRLAAEL